jgi:hypothetical protein
MSQQTTIKTTDALSDLFGYDAKIVRTSVVTIPTDMRAMFAKAVTAFASAPNTARVTQTRTSEDDAKLYAKQIRQYATETSRTALVTITGCDVTWRFSKITPSVRGKSRKTNPVTVTHTNAA